MQVKQNEPNKGRMQVWNEEFGQDRMVGFLDPDTNVFTPDRTFTKGARQFEEDFFTTPEGKKLIRQQSKNTVVKSKIEDGENITEAQKEANKLRKMRDEINSNIILPEQAILENLYLYLKTLEGLYLYVLQTHPL